MTKQWRINTRRKLIRQRKACSLLDAKSLSLRICQDSNKKEGATDLPENPSGRQDVSNG